MSGVYELDVSQMVSQMGIPQVQGMPDMQKIMKDVAASAGGSERITFDGNRIVMQMGLMEIRGTYKVKNDIIYVTAEGYGPNGQFPLYIVDDDNIKYGGAVFRRKQ